MEWLVFQLASIASIPLSSLMASERGRSCRVWTWMAALIGPFAPLALFILGNARRLVRAN